MAVNLAVKYSDKGVTPAHAGKIITEHITEKNDEGHPRTCGENSIFSLLFDIEHGSPPHTRGKSDRLRSKQGL